MRLCAVFALIFTCASSLAASPFSFPNPFGPHPVGLQVTQQVDPARAYRGRYDVVTGQPHADAPGRPLQTLVWYPASASGTPLRLHDYLQLSGSEDHFSRTAEQATRVADTFIRSHYFSESGPVQGQAALADTLRAQRDAPAADGRFPVVIYAPSISAPAAENADLCEYLASHGYIVIASPSLGPQGRKMPNTLAGAETHAADIAFLIRYAHTLPHADSTRIAVAGYSWGGLANVLAAARDQQIKALVNLDGSVRYYPELVAAANYVTPRTLTVPMLYIASRPMSLEKIAARGKPLSTLFNELKYSDLYKLTMQPMEHFAFSSVYLRFASDAMFDQYSRAEVNRAFGWSAEYVLQFLDAYLKEDKAAKTWLQAPPTQHGIPAFAATLETQLASPLPLGRADLAAELAQRGFTQAMAAYQALRARDAQFALTEAELNEWGYDLLRIGQPNEAIALLRFVTELHPDSANAYDSLADAYDQAGDAHAAISNYQRSLKLDPGNRNAVQRLARLKPRGAVSKPAPSS